jgi:predicted nucleic acid-binding protein
VLAIAQSVNELLVLPVVVLPEVCNLIASRLGHQAMRRFVSSMPPDVVQVDSVIAEDLVRVHQSLEQYADNQLDFADAAIVAIAERLDITRVHTLNRRNFWSFVQVTAITLSYSLKPQANKSGATD